MNSFDYIAVASLIAAAMRGYRQGLARELFRLLRIAAALVAGSGLLGLVSSWFSHASAWMGPVVFVGGAGGAWLLLRSLRKWSEAWLILHTPRRFQSVGGSVAAIVKTAIFLGGVIATFHLATWIPGHALVAERSIASRMAGPFLVDRADK